MEWRIPVVSTGTDDCLGLRRVAHETTRVTTCPPFPPLMPAVSVSAPSSYSMTIWPPVAYHDVDCTAVMKVRRKASAWAGVPSCWSSITLGVYHTKSGGLTELRSPINDVESAIA